MNVVTKQKVSINFARFWAGVGARELINIILVDLEPFVEFEISNSPQILLYGPYPGELPKGRFVKVFIGCENVRPIMSECDWAFGVEHEDCVRDPRYMRIARWGDDSPLIQKDKNWSEILQSKTRFAVFLYANKVFYREAFFSALSRYKRVDAPGQSMNNMPNIDPIPGQRDWKAKVEFLRGYKFVIAFENGSQSGYNTEKLTHAIEADCLPIYWGDPEIARSFNVRRFINAHDYLPMPRTFIPRLPYSPHSIKSENEPTFAERVARRFNGTASQIEQRTWALAGFTKLTKRIIQIDQDDKLYLQYLGEPFLIENRPPDRSGWISRWREIFASV
jgi:alpha(1,3/1,4) fucosyltransferase